MDSADDSVFAWVRFGEGDVPPVLVVSNFTPVERSSRRLGVPAGGRWREVLNTDATIYGGAGRGNFGGVNSTPHAANGFADSIAITLPPLSTLFFQLDR